MARTCTVCRHPQLEEIHQALLTGASYRAIAHQFRGVSQSALQRHVKHIPFLLRERAAIAGNRVARVLAQSLEICEATARECRSERKIGSMLAALAETRKTSELILKMCGLLAPAEVSVTAEPPDLYSLGVRLLEALGPYPEARAAAARALLEGRSASSGTSEAHRPAGQPQEEAG